MHSLSHNESPDGACYLCWAFNRQETPASAVVCADGFGRDEVFTVHLSVCGSCLDDIRDTLPAYYRIEPIQEAVCTATA